MNESDAIVVVPFLLLVAIVTVYALMALYTEIVLIELTCRECGKVLPTDKAMTEHIQEHVKAHSAEPVQLPQPLQAQEHESAA